MGSDPVRLRTTMSWVTPTPVSGFGVERADKGRVWVEAGGELGTQRPTKTFL